MSANTVVDEFEFKPIQFQTAQGDLGFHNINDGDENQRPDIIDEMCMGMFVQARLDRVVHGTETQGGEPATLIVFGFRFHGLHKERRLRTAEIKILFQDEKKRARKDPVVVGMWPNGEFTLTETPVKMRNLTGGEVGGEAGAVGLAATVALKLERETEYQYNDRSTITGSIILDLKVRNYGPKNAVRLTLTEDESNKTGVVTDLRVPVLVLRKGADTDRFGVFVKITATGNFLQNTAWGLRNLCHAPANDPVWMKPGLDYLRAPTLASALEEKLAAEVEKDALGKLLSNLEDFGAALGTTKLA
ncbi:hypothetical protein H072_4033 [Dactylellina haptotyla CBS 200.50]|uniref:Uncharacterized protein n=1 Tax=Dactylellina haptotyla (strain CBS 200.50) TaxID=1284197 RepID=S8AGM0_DACHA|nr:hypothetical protein H072_4033 [Dactylellina haptotyla CBS 200.50]